MQSRIGVCQLSIAIPAVLGAITVCHRAAIARSQGFESLLREVHGISQVIIIAVADVEMYFASQFRCESGPVTRDNVGEIKMLAPIRRNSRVDGAGHLIEDRLWIAILSH